MKWKHIGAYLAVLFILLPGMLVQSVISNVFATETNNTSENITIPVPPFLNTTEPQGPDEQCLFDPSLPQCAPVDGECPDGFTMNVNEQCIPLGGCPDGYHTVEDDETGTCYPDDIPCPQGQVMSEVGNYCIVPDETEQINGGNKSNSV